MTEKEAREAAAKKYCRYDHTHENKFISGAQWALKESPTVKKLVAAVKLGLENTNSDFCGHGNDPDCIWCRPFLEALADYKKVLEE